MTFICLNIELRTQPLIILVVITGTDKERPGCSKILSERVVPRPLAERGPLWLSFGIPGRPLSSQHLAQTPQPIQQDPFVGPPPGGLSLDPL
jgi:hypothetical protein